MSVANIKRGDDYDVYIGRPGHGHDGSWGNPYAIGADMTREQAIAAYRTTLWTQIQSGVITLEELAALHGKTLGCFCAPKACHGDVLTKAAAWAYQQLDR